MRRPRAADGIRNDVVLGLDRWHQAATIPGPLDEHVGAGHRRSGSADASTDAASRANSRRPKVMGSAAGARSTTVDRCRGLGAEDEVGGLDELGHELARDEPLAPPGRARAAPAR